MIRVAKVKDNKDEEKLGRVKVEIIPEFQGFLDNQLPWANPKQKFDASKDFSQNVPDKDSYILVEVNNTWTQFSYDLTMPFSNKKDGMEAAYKFLSENLPSYTANAPEPVKLEYSSTPEYLKFEDKTNGQLGIIFSNGRYLYWSGKDEKKMIFGYKDIKYMEILENGSFTFLLNIDNQNYSQVKLNESGDFQFTTDMQKPLGNKNILDMKADGTFKFTNNQPENKAGFIEYKNDGKVTIKNNTHKSSIELDSSTGNISAITDDKYKIILQKDGNLMFEGKVVKSDNLALFTEINRIFDFLLNSHTHKVIIGSNTYTTTAPSNSPDPEYSPNKVKAN